MYVPHNAMAAGKKLDKWSERTRVGVYLGKSSQHARTVALVLSLTTGLTSPQFTSNLIRPSKQCARAFMTSRFHRSGRLSVDSRFTRASQDHQLSLQREQHPQPRHLTAPRMQTHFKNPRTSASLTKQRQCNLQREPWSSLPRHQLRNSGSNLNSLNSLRGSTPDGASHRSAWTKRTRSGNTMLLSKHSQSRPLLSYAAASDPDTMYLHQATKEPDKDQFLESMVQEVDSNTAAGNWSILHKSKIPQGSPVIPAVWQMKRKRRISTREV
jgi:hypothetical protein